MKSPLLAGISCALIILSILASGNGVKAAEYVPGEILVKYKDLTRTSSINSLHSRVGSVRKKEFTKIRVEHVKLPSHMSVEEAVEYYKLDPNVEYAEPNYIVHMDAATPDDTSFGNLWGLNNTGQSGGTDDADIDAPEAWDIETGSRNTVVIAVIDSGVAYNHPDLNANIWTNTGETSCVDGIDNDGNGYIDDCNGWDFFADNNDPTDYNGHGTHVAGTIAAVGNNTAGITGVMWQAKIMPLRFLGVYGSGATSDAISAILYANANGADVINNSWGGTGFSQALKDAIGASSAVVVCAAGNDGTDNDAAPHYPSNFTSPNIISVASTDHNDALSSFSNYGIASVDVAAPGSSIYSSIPQFSYGAPIDVYTVSGAEDFDSQTGALPTSGSLSGWRRGGTNSTWTITAGTGVGETNSLEDSPGVNYLDSTYSWAGYMTPVTSEKNNRYTLTFQWKGELEEYFDRLYFNYSLDGVNWYPIENDYITGSSGGGFVQYSADFTPVADSLDQFYFGFGLYSDNSINKTGVYIDNVTLTREPISISGYSYASYQGTSMAAPHVSGVAGLIKAKVPALTNLEIKNAIVNSVEIKSSLECKVATAGRINAYTALLSAQGDPSGLTVGTPRSCVSPPVANGGGGGRKCFIATAAFGSMMHPQVKALRDFRDNHLLTNSFGRAFVDFYYEYSPPIADIIGDHKSLRFITRIILTPAVMFVVFPFTSSIVFASLIIALMLVLKRCRKHTKCHSRSLLSRNPDKELDPRFHGEPWMPD